MDSAHYQITIMTVVTHLILSLSVFNTPLLSWNIVRHPNANHQTMHLILATLALKRYYFIWFTSSVAPFHTTPTDWVIPLSDSTLMARGTPIPVLPRPYPSNQHTMTTSQLSLLPLIHDDKFKRSNSTTQNHTQRSLCPRPAKRYKIQPPWQYHNQG